MSRFSGLQGKGAARRYREKKRVEAEERKALTTLVKTKSSKQKNKKRRQKKVKPGPDEKLLQQIFGDPDQPVAYDGHGAPIYPHQMGPGQVGENWIDSMTKDS